MKKNTQQTIANLLRKADSVAGTPEEAAFRAKALELMSKYNFDEAAVRKTSDESQIICDEIEFSGAYIQSQKDLFQVISNHFGCQVIHLSKDTIEVFGVESAVEQADWLFDLLWVQALGQCLNAKDGNRLYGADKTRWRKSFLHGFVMEVKARFAEIAREASKSENGPSKEGQLVILDDAKRAFEALKAMHPGVRSSTSRRTVNANAAAAGRSSARNSDIGQGRVAGQRAIGA